MGKELSLIARGAGFYFAGFAISKVLAYIYRVLVARTLGPADFGIFSLGVAVLGIVLVFAALGLYQGILHFVAVYDSTGEPAKVRGTILFGLKLQLVSSIIFALAMFLSADFVAVYFFHEPSAALVIKILSVALPFYVLTSNLMILAQAFKKIEYKILLRNVIENIIKIAITAALIFFGFGLFGITAGLALSITATFFISLYLVHKKVFPLFKRGEKPVYSARQIFSYSWPLLAVGFFSLLLSSTDTIMLGNLSEAYDVGIYNVAQPTANLLLIASFAFGSLFLPVITGLWAQKKVAEFATTFKVVTRWTVATAFPCLLFTLLFASEILGVMFGDVYAEGAGALMILSLGVFSMSLGGSTSSILESIRKTKLVFLNSVFCGLLNVALNAWLIPVFQASGDAIIGAAIATAISYSLWNLLALAEVYALIKIHPYNRAYISPIVASFISIAVFFALKAAIPPIQSFSFPINFIALSAFGCFFLALYGLLFVVLRGIQAEDLAVLKSLENKTGFKVKFARDFVKRFS